MESLGVARFAVVAALLPICAGAFGAAPPDSENQFRRNEVWIAIRSDASPGSGKSGDPFDGSAQPRFDAVMAAIPPYTTIHFSPGTFVTKGIIPKSGWRLYLSSKTTLRLDVLLWIPGQKWAIFGAGAPDSVGDLRIEGGIWDCNLQGQKIPMAAQAIAFAGGGGNITIKDIKVINWGSTFPGAECFVVGVFNVGRTGKIARNIVLDGIEVTQPAPMAHLASSSLIGTHGQDPVNPKGLSSGWLEQVEIRNCYVHDIDIPVMTASVQMGSWCHRVHIHHNRFENLGPKNNTLFGCYLDTGASSNVLVEENIFSGVVHSVWALLTTPYPVTNWVIRDNRIQINRYVNSGGIELRGLNTTIRNIRIERNIISSVDGKSLNTCGIALKKVSGGILRQNVIDDINGSAHIVYEKEVEGMELVENRKRNGTAIRARTERGANAQSQGKDSAE